MERESALMYRSTRQMLKEIRKQNVDDYLLAEDAFYDYALDGIEPDLEGAPLVVRLFWQAAKPLIDANNRNYINGCKGGAPEGNQNARKQPKTTEKQPKNNPNSTKKQPKTTQKQGNDNVNDNDKVKDKVTAHVNDNEHVNVNDINRNPYISVDENGEEYVVDMEKYDEWEKEHGNYESDEWISPDEIEEYGKRLVMENV